MKSGFWTYYYPDGTVRKEGRYAVNYFPSEGYATIETDFVSYKFYLFEQIHHGIWKECHEDGTLSWKGSINKDELTGEWIKTTIP